MTVSDYMHRRSAIPSRASRPDGSMTGQQLRRQQEGPCSPRPLHDSAGENASHVADDAGTSGIVSRTGRMGLNTRLNQSEKLVEVSLQLGWNPQALTRLNGIPVSDLHSPGSGVFEFEDLTMP